MRRTTRSGRDGFEWGGGFEGGGRRASASSNPVTPRVESPTGLGPMRGLDAPATCSYTYSCSSVLTCSPAPPRDRPRTLAARTATGRCRVQVNEHENGDEDRRRGPWHPSADGGSRQVRAGPCTWARDDRTSFGGSIGDDSPLCDPAWPPRPVIHSLRVLGRYHAAAFVRHRIPTTDVES